MNYHSRLSVLNIIAFCSSFIMNGSEIAQRLLQEPIEYSEGLISPCNSSSRVQGAKQFLSLFTKTHQPFIPKTPSNFSLTQAVSTYSSAQIGMDKARKERVRHCEQKSLYMYCS